MDHVGNIIRSAIEDRIIHGAAVVSGTAAMDDFEFSAGFADAAHQFPMRIDTVVDIASVTKVTAMITALLILHSRRMIDFDADFTSYLDCYKPKLKQKISVRDLANHVSGFMDVPGESRRRYFDESGRRMLDLVLNLPPPFRPTSSAQYACWNYILLCLVLERITRRSFPDFCREEIFLPLKMTSSFIGTPPPDFPIARLAQTFGTEHPGMISDFIASRIYRDGGATGNAGMFSSAADLAVLMRVYLRHGAGDGTRLFSENSFAEISPDRENRTEGYRRFGWVIYDEHMDDSDFGCSLLHSGWSGQTVFLNFRKSRFVVVLTTRCGDYERAKCDRFAMIRQLLDGGGSSGMTGDFRKNNPI